MKKRRMLVLWVLLVAGVVGLHFIYNSEDSWVDLPFPGAGLSVAAPFRIESGGDFLLELMVPVPADDLSVHLPPIPPVRGSLQIEIASKNGFREEFHVGEFMRHSQRGFSHLNVFEVSPVRLPRRGEYEIKITNMDGRSCPDVFDNAGAMLSLHRNYKKPMEGAVGFLMVLVLAHILIAISAICMLVTIVRTKR